MQRPILFAWPAAIALAIAACGGAAMPPPTVPGVHLWEGDDHTSEGDVVIPGLPADNYEVLSDYRRWPQIFRDVAHVEIQGPAADEDAIKVLLVTTEGQNNNLRFRNDPAHLVVRFHDTGGAADVLAEIAFEPASVPGSTRVHARLFADVHGFLGLFVTDAKLREQRQKKLSSDLADIQKYFRKR